MTGWIIACSRCGPLQIYAPSLVNPGKSLICARPWIGPGPPVRPARQVIVRRSGQAPEMPCPRRIWARTCVDVFRADGRRRGEQPLPVAQARRGLPAAELARGRRASARRSPAACAALGVGARRPGGAGRREPAGMADRRSRDHGRGRDHRAGLHHQHRRATTPTSRAQRRQGRDRVDRAPGRRSCCRRRPGAGRRVCVIGMEPLRGRRPAEPRRARLGRRSLAAASSRRDAGPPTGRAAVARRDTACIIYTSGTGGAPKGVMLQHGTILAQRRRAAAAARRCSASATRSSSRSCRCRTPTSTPPASSSRSRSARRSTTPRASTRSPPTCSRRGRPS